MTVPAIPSSTAAVRWAPVDAHSAMSPAPTRTAVEFGSRTETSASSKLEAPVRSAMVMRAAYSPNEAYVWFLVIGAPFVNVEPLVVVPSPHAMVHVHGWSTAPPSSLNVAFIVYGLVTWTVTSGPALTLGAMLAMVAVVDTGSLARPRASVTTSVTAYVPLRAYVFVGWTPPPVVPSPKVQAYVSGRSLSTSV